jgi:hypothetical protein
MRVRRWLAAIVAAGLAATAGIIGVASPAQAASCASGYICFFDNTNGTTLLEQALATSYPRSICESWSGQTYKDNKVGYIVNNSGYSFVVYLNYSCSGTSAPVYANSQGAMNSTWNNSISSIFRA